jgi:RNA polymerase sigma-70 factor (ECF subfamily)
MDRTDDLEVFESHRRLLLSLAYRMLGDVGRAEDLVQEAWLRWVGRESEAEQPRSWLVTTVSRLCLNELDSARHRREESRGDRLPEPMDLEQGGLGRIEALDRISMAFLVMLQRLSPAERAVLLLHDVFDLSHREIASLVDKTEAGCRKLLERARERVADEKRLFATSRETHERLLGAFYRAVTAGDASALVSMLAEDAVLVTDGGPGGRKVGGLGNLVEPLHGAHKVAAYVVEASRRGEALEAEVHELNGQPGIVLYRDGAPFAAVLLGVSEDGRVHRVFFHGDVGRMRYLGQRAG